MLFNRNSAISSQNGKPVKLVDQFIYLGSNIAFTESDVIIRIGKAWIPIDILSIRLKSDLSDKVKQEFFQAVAVSILLYGYTLWNVTKHLEKKLDRKAQIWCIMFRTNPLGSNLQKSGYTATYLPSHKPSNLNEQDMLSTAGEIRTNSWATFCY